MKKLIQEIVIIALMSIMIIGCEKEDNLSIPNKENQTNVNSSNERVKHSPISKNENDTIFIDSINFNDEFLSFGENYFNSHPYGYISIEYISDKQLYSIITQDPGPHLPNSPDRIICRGDQGAVLNCANLYVNFSIEGCAVDVYEHSSGMAWIAETRC